MNSKGTHQFRSPKRLTVKDEPIHRIRCPIHGFIQFSDNEKRIIDHPLFHRLRFIKQLGLTDYVYPGANHTRFEHSIGVMELATKFYDAFLERNGAIIEAKFKELPQLKDRPLSRARRWLRLAGLLHDIGHVPFSHAAEDVFLSGMKHEWFTLRLLRGDTYLRREIDQIYEQGASEVIAKIIEGGRQLEPQLSILHDIISGQMDADRTDYLLRDSLHCGVDYGKFDYRRLIVCLEVEMDKETDELKIALERGGLHSFETLITARYQMNTQVYCHRLRRLYDLYLHNYFSELKKEQDYDDEFLLHNNDTSLLARIFSDAEMVSERGKWAKRIKTRNHYTVVFETEENVTTSQMRNWEAFVSDIKQRFPDSVFIPDIANEKIHNMLQKDEIINESEEDKYVIMPIMDKRGGEVVHAGDISQILGQMPRRFQCARLFADFEGIKQSEVRKIRKYAKKHWR